MSFQSLPSQDGVYRIKCLDEDLYIESIPKSETTARYGRPWTRLVAPTGSTKQQWFLTLAPNLNGYRIQSAFDKKGLIFIKTSDTYRGYGFPYPDGESTDWSGDTVHWQIFQRQGQQYATIGTPRSANNDLVFDSQQMYRSDGDYAVHFWPRDESSSAPHQRFVFQYVGPTPAPDPDEPDMKLDVVFLQDATGSQQPYIDAARQHINNICIDLKKESGFKHDDDLRFRLIAFRDHPPQEPAFLLKPFDFTSSTTQLMNDLGGLRADGGGDGPEAQTDALDAALNSAWRDDAAKVVVLVTDAPPHGIEDSGDEFPDGCPLQLDPCRVVDLCADNGITLHIIGCEPTLSSDYTHAKDFYEGIAKKTNGDFVPLTKVDGDSTQLKAAVVGLAAKALDTQRLAKQLSARILAEAHRSHDAISADLHKDLSAQGVHHHQVLAASVYTSSRESNHNVNVWAQASSVKEAKNKLQKTSGSQLADQGRSSGSYAVSYTKEPITRADTDAIVAKALKKAGRYA